MQQRLSLPAEATTTKWSNTMSTPKKNDVTITFDIAPQLPEVEGESIVQSDVQGLISAAHS